MPPSVVLLLVLLLGLLGSVGSLAPRISFLLNSADRPVVHFADVHNATTLLLSNDGSTLYVGAKDAVLSLDVSQSDIITLKGKVQWSPSDSEISDCQTKGKDPKVDCPNFVGVLQQMNSTHLYACGSFAFSPHDAFIDAETLSMDQRGFVKGRCPFNPAHRSIALAVDGELFTATTTNFRGDEPQISRHFSRGGRPDVSLDSPVGLLEDPVFVSSSTDSAERKLYFFFSEVGKEFSFVDKLQIARVAQVCKDDTGGQRTLQKKWTSFAKAALLCQAPKQLPFNVLQDVFTLPPPEGADSSQALFYAVFTSQWSSGPESAVCVFKLQDIRTTFSENYRTFNAQTNLWSPLLGRHSYLGKCGLDNASDSELAEVKRSFLTGRGVKPVTDGPVVVSSEQRFSRVAAMRTKAADGKEFTVLFLLTESGFLQKVVLLNQGPRVVEEIQVFTEPQLLKSIKLSPSKGVLYVGTAEGVAAVPVARCSIYRTCIQCVLARDPLCGWSRSGGVCTGLTEGPETLVQDVENGKVEACGRQTGPRPTRISARLNEAVRLQCPSPSSLASLTWTYPRLVNKELFIQSADGSLHFLASDATFGTYRCEAEEGGIKEVVMAYSVQPLAPPRSISPQPGADERHTSVGMDATDEPLPQGDPEDTFTGETVSKNQDSGLKTDGTFTPSKDAQTPGKETPDAVVIEKSYLGELVVVSLLLVACLCFLAVAALHVWRQRKTDHKVNPLVGPETDAEPEADASPEKDTALEIKVGE